MQFTLAIPLYQPTQEFGNIFTPPSLQMVNVPLIRPCVRRRLQVHNYKEIVVFRFKVHWTL